MKRVLGKKAMAAVTAVLMLAAAVPSAALAEETTGEQVQIQENAVTVAVQEETQPILNAAEGYFTVDTNGTLTGYTGPGGDVVIPETVGGVKVTSLGYAFLVGGETITSITVPNGVTVIDGSDFRSCSALETVNIHENVSRIEGNPFDSCTSLKNINVDSNNRYFTTENGILYNKGMTVLIKCPTNKSGKITIPDSITSIHSSAFKDCKDITEITIPSGVRYIQFSTFKNCSSLAKADIRGTISDVGQSAFENCTSLESIAINFEYPGGSYYPGYIFYDAFSGCTALKNVELTRIGSIHDYAFNGCTALESITLPSGLHSISHVAFDNSSLKNITFEGDAPSVSDGSGGEATIMYAGPNTTVYYKSGATGFTSPTWKGLASQMIEGTVSGDTQSSSGSSAVPPSTEIMFADLTPAEQQTAQKKVLDMLGITTAAAGQELFYYDITLVDKATGQAYTASNFPKEGITVTIPFPLGKTMYSHNYRLFHFPNGVDGNMVEITPINVTMNGIGFHVNGLSPFVLVAEQNRTSSGGGGITGNGANVVYNGAKSPKTGDAGCMAIIKAYIAQL